jgi:hypothetical protein
LNYSTLVFDRLCRRLDCAVIGNVKQLNAVNEMMHSQRSQPAILWAQVTGLAAIQGAITLTWVVYNLYLPQLLDQLGLPQAIGMSLLVIESLLAVVLEPVMGSVSDQMRQWVGRQFPLITLGVVLASALFISIPSAAIFGSTTAAVRWVLPGTIIAWAIAMAVFRSPALALLGRYAVGTKLPEAASLLTLMGALTGALGGFANQFILSLGSAIAFALGSLVLLGAIALLRALNPPSAQASAPVPTASEPSALPMLGLLLGVGLGVGVGSTLMRKVLSALSPQVNPSLFISLFAIAHILTVVPSGRLAEPLGNRRTMSLGIGTMAGLLGLMVVVPGAAIVITLLLGAAFSLVINGTIPLALSLVPPSKAGLAVGIYFSGAALASSLSGVAAKQLSNLSIEASSWLAILALLMAGGCIVASDRLQKDSTNSAQV